MKAVSFMLGGVTLIDPYTTPPYWGGARARPPEAPLAALRDGADVELGAVLGEVVEPTLQARRHERLVRGQAARQGCMGRRGGIRILSRRRGPRGRGPGNPPLPQKTSEGGR